MGREWMGLPEGVAVDTKYGQVEIKPVSLTCVMVNANDFGEGLTVRGVTYRVRVHFNLRGGKCEEVPGSYFNRGGGKPVSKPAQESMLAELASVVTAWVRDNPQRMADAGKREINNKLVSMEKEIRQLEESLADMRAREKSLLAELEALG